MGIHKSFTFLPLILILAISIPLIIYLAVKISPQVSNTLLERDTNSNNQVKSGYKTHTNSEGLYKINYPESWVEARVYSSYYDLKPDLAVMNYVDIPRGLGFVKNEIQLSTGFVMNSAENSKTYFSQFDKDLNESVGIYRLDKTQGRLTKLENITVSNNPGVKFKYESNYEGSVYGLLHYFKTKDALYVINFFTQDEGTMDIYQDEINETIKSFQIISE